MHCNIDMLAAQYSREGKRSWHNMCVSLTEYVKSDRYDLYLVPFLKQERLVAYVKKRLGMSVNECVRHDIYAVNRHSPIRQRVISIILDHKGIEYSSRLETIGHAVCGVLASGPS